MPDISEIIGHILLGLIRSKMTRYRIFYIKILSFLNFSQYNIVERKCLPFSANLSTLYFPFAQRKNVSCATPICFAASLDDILFCSHAN